MSGLTVQQLRAEDRRFGNTAPVRTLDQRLDALALGNRHRTLRKELKQDIAAGRTTLADALLEPIPAWLETMKVYDLVLSAPKIGPTKANKMFVRIRLSHSKTVGGMTARQRMELVSLVQR